MKAQAAAPARQAVAVAQTPAPVDDGDAAAEPPGDGTLDASTNTATAMQYLPWIAGGDGSMPAVGASVVEPMDAVTTTTPMPADVAPAPATETNVELLAGAAQPWFLPLIMRSDPPATLDLLVTPTLGTAPLTTHMTATLGGAVVTTGDLPGLVWHFSDGATASGAIVSHTFTTPGVYTVTLTTTSYPSEQTLQRTVTVYDRSQFSVGQVDAAGGVVTTHEGDLWLDFAPGAVQEPYAVFIRQIDLTSVTTDTVDGAPQLEVPGFGLPFRQISLHAVRLSDSTWLTQTTFSAPVTITHVYSEAVDDQLLPESLHFVYANPASGQWEEIASTVDLEHGQVQALLSHFSDYGVAGDQAAWKTPTLAAADVSLAQGQSSYGYALPLPAGPGGFAPKVNLSYNSGQPNSMAGAKNTDGGWVGVGWTLDLGHMTSTNSRSTASLANYMPARTASTTSRKTPGCASNALTNHCRPVAACAGCTTPIAGK
jgi:PKD repeat protein